ncbi:MAG: hypothetical protein K8W52_39945 [Deltaproteobacteria bacterium]|nr:hypothetical protein [Deltaproteobacteria bacterium]
MTASDTAPGVGDPACPHVARDEGVCRACGHCLHELILNLACFHCGSTDLDPVALSNKPADQALIPADRLRRKP